MHTPFEQSSKMAMRVPRRSRRCCPSAGYRPSLQLGCSRRVPRAHISPPPPDRVDRVNSRPEQAPTFPAIPPRGACAWGSRRRQLTMHTTDLSRLKAAAAFEISGFPVGRQGLGADLSSEQPGTGDRIPILSRVAHCSGALTSRDRHKTNVCLQTGHRSGKGCSLHTNRAAVLIAPFENRRRNLRYGATFRHCAASSEA